MAGRGDSKKPAVKKKSSASAPSKTKTRAKPAPPKASKTTTKAAKKTPAKKSSSSKAAATAKTKATVKKSSVAKKAAGAKKKARAPAVASSRPAASRTPTTERSPTTQPDGVPAPTPSERVLATRGELPAERSLTDEEREAMAKVSETARRFVGAKGAPAEIIGSIARFLEDVRLGNCDEPKSQDVRLGLGVLWGEQLRAQVGWRWVHLSYPDGFASYALVPDDRAFACFPLNRVPEALQASKTNTSAHVFDSIREGELPTRRANAYLVIG